MKEDWKKYKLGEIAYFVEEKISSDELTLNEYITTDCLLQNKKGRTIATNLPPKSCSLTKFKKGDVLIGNIRPYLKKIWFAESAGGCSLDVLVLRAKKMEEASFLYSLLLQDDFFDFVMKAPKGSKMPRGDKNHILTYPCFDIQNKIEVGSFIKSLDDKIALNKRINAKLETMAKRLYDYWFVQFDYPDKNGKPYKTSGGKMVWNEVLKREIPVGWEVGALSDIANITMGQSPEGSSYNENGRGTIFYQGSTDFGIRFPTVRMFTTEPARFAQKGDILMSVRAPVGAMNIANTDCCIGRGLSAMNSKIGSITYLYYIMDYFRHTFENKNGAGTTFGSITKDELFELPVVIPDSNILKQFEFVVKPIFDKQMNIGFEIQKLTDLRDRLLPLLMNGQVEVSTNNSSEFCNAKLGKQATACDMNGQVEVIEE